MSSLEERIRAAAKELDEAMIAAREEGLVIVGSLEHLAGIAISAGRKMLSPEEIGEIARADAQREQDAEKAQRVVPEPIAITAPTPAVPVTRTAAPVSNV